MIKRNGGGVSQKKLKDSVGTTMNAVSDYMIETSGLTKRFGNFVAVDHVSLQVKPGEIFGFLGPNGAGKTTTVRMLCGLMGPSGGSVHVAGYDVLREPERAKSQIGYMPQKFSLYDDLTVWENLEFFSGIYGVPRHLQHERIEDKLKLVQLEQSKGRLTGKLSGGMKQRIGLACALIHNPKLLMLDEPTAGVDPPLRRVFWDYFRNLKEQGVTIFVNTHYMDEALRCDVLGLMSRGKLVRTDTPDGLKEAVVGGQAVDLVTSNSEKATASLKTLSNVKRVDANDGNLRVVVLDADRAILEIPPVLEAAGIKTLSIRPVDITLEDVFIKLIGKETQD